MKTLRVLTLLLLPFVALAQNAPFPPASTSDVVAGTERNKFVSPYTLSQAGFSSPTGGITAAVATNIAAYQAQLATNGLTGGPGGAGALTNNDTRAIDLKYATIGDKYSSVTFANYLGGATNATLYRQSQYIYTNSSSAMVFFDFGMVGKGPPTITNAAHNDLVSDYAAVNLGVNLPGESVASGWEDTLGALPTMSGTYTSSSNNVFGNQVSANTFNPYGIANFGSNVSSTIDNNGLASDSSSVKVNINQDSDNYKVGIAVINKYPNLTEWYLENQTNGTRLTDLVLGVNAFAQAFIGSSALFRIIDPVSPYPHLNLLTANRTNGVITISNLVVTGTITGNGAGLTNLSGVSGSGIATNGGTGINNRFTNTVFAGTIGFSNDVTIAGDITVAGTFNVGTLNATNFTVTNPWNAVNATNIQATNITGLPPSVMLLNGNSTGSFASGAQKWATIYPAGLAMQSTESLAQLMIPVSAPYTITNFHWGIVGVLNSTTNISLRLYTNGVAAGTTVINPIQGNSGSSAYYYTNDTSYSVAVAGTSMTNKFSLAVSNAVSAGTVSLSALWYSFQIVK